MFYYIALGIGVVVSLAFVFVRMQGNTVHILIFKAVASVFFLLSAVFATIDNGGAAYLYGPLIIMGGSLGLVGDILLDLKGVYKQDANEYLKGGFVFFLVGHIFYIGAMLYNNRLPWWVILICAGVSIVVAAADVLSANIMKMHYGKYRRVLFFYVMFLCMFMCVALASAIRLHSKSAILMAIGAVSFTLSDIVLSGTYFGRGYDGKVWIFINHFLYYAGQYLIASSVFFLE